MESRLTRIENIFETIDSEQKAYWLGFLCADGCVHQGQYDYRVELGLSEQDYQHLEKFKKFIGRDNKIAYRPKTKSYRYSFRDKSIHHSLIKQGCVPAKSLILTFPEEHQVASVFLKDYLRGYFDGDGSFWKSNGKLQGSILGTKSFLQGLQTHCKYLEKYKIVPIHKKASDRGQRIVFSGKNAKDFLSYLYDGATIYLDRKFQKYQDIVATS